MKVFTLMYWSYEDTHLVGVFSSYEKAVERQKTLPGTKLPFKSGGVYRESQFEIDDPELDELPPS